MENKFNIIPFFRINNFCWLVFLMILFFSQFNSCKTNETDISFNQEQLIGTWLSTQQDNNKCTMQFIITVDSLKKYPFCNHEGDRLSILSHNVASDSIIYQNYSFDGQKVIATDPGLLGHVEFRIKELTETKLVWTYYHIFGDRSSRGVRSEFYKK